MTENIKEFVPEDNLSGEDLKNQQELIDGKQRKLDDYLENRLGEILRSLGIEYGEIKLFTTERNPNTGEGVFSMGSPSFLIKPPINISNPRDVNERTNLNQWLSMCLDKLTLRFDHVEVTTEDRKHIPYNGRGSLLDNEDDEELFYKSKELDPGKNYVIVYEIPYSKLNKPEETASQTRVGVTDVLEAK